MLSLYYIRLNSFKIKVCFYRKATEGESGRREEGGRRERRQEEEKKKEK